METHNINGQNVNIVWAAQPGPQQALIDCPLPLIGYGGARGGGKTDGVLGKFGILAETMGKDFNGIFFRRELPQADDLIERAKEIYLPLEAHYNDQKKQFTFAGGGRLRFRPLANNVDAEKYQGQNLSHAAIEEAGNYPSPEPIFKLFGALRGQNVQMILTFNPGGPGHWWIKEKFIRPAPKGWKMLEWELPTGKKVPYIFIPSKVQDNKILLTKDPGYIDRLHMVGSPELVRAWLEGDFEIHEGSFFPEFSSKHILTPFNVPKHWPRYLGFDWGYRSPFAAVWGAVSSGKGDDGQEVSIPKGAIVIYREMWGKQIENKEQAERIASASVGENVQAVADPSIFATDGGPSINDQFNSVFIKYKHPSFRRADNDRVGGWSQIRRRLQNDAPLLYVFSTCPYLIESLPALQIDLSKAEDADTTGDDHACFTGDTKIITRQGYKSLQELENRYVEVLSHDNEWHWAICAKTKDLADLIEFQFNDGTLIRCTPDHKFMMQDGSFKQASSLDMTDTLYFVNDECRKAIVTKIELAIPEKVYCLNVPESGTFALANGAVVHNCDALRYLCKERLLDSEYERPTEKVVEKGKVKLQLYVNHVRNDQKRARL